MKDFRKALSNQSQLSFYNRQGGIVTYTIEREIGRGSSCIVYDASYETNAGDRKLVRLKECYPYKLDIHRLEDGSLQATKECEEEFKIYQEKMIEDFLLSNRLFETEGLNDSITNFIDIYDLADRLKQQLEADFNEHFQNSTMQTAAQMFRHIYENQLFYKTYFKLGYTEKHGSFVFDKVRAENDFQGKHILYHIEFFRNGLNAIIRLWLENGCRESPEEMAEIIQSEYRGR